MDTTPTPSQTVGPYFHLGCTANHAVNCIAGPAADGEHITLTCRVLDGEDVPVPDAMIEIWQADAKGRYNHPFDANSGNCDPACNGFGRMATDGDGICNFDTIKPGRVAAEGGRMQAPHLNVSVFARGLLQRLATRIYFDADPGNAECPILTLVPDERRSTLLAHPDPAHPGHWHFDIHLCGSHETVFFDV